MRLRSLSFFPEASPFDPANAFKRFDAVWLPVWLPVWLLALVLNGSHQSGGMKDPFAHDLQAKCNRHESFLLESLLHRRRNGLQQSTISYLPKPVIFAILMKRSQGFA